MNDAYSQFLAWERTSSDNLLVKKMVMGHIWANRAINGS